MIQDNFSDDEVDSIFQQAAQKDVDIHALRQGLSRDQLFEIAKQSGISEDSLRMAIDIVKKGRSSSTYDEPVSLKQKRKRIGRKLKWRIAASIGVTISIAIPAQAVGSWMTSENSDYEAYRVHSQRHLVAADQANTRESAQQALAEALPWLNEQAALDDELPPQKEAAISDLDSLSRVLSDTPNTLLNESEKAAIDQGVETIDQYYSGKSFESRLILIASGIGFGACLIVMLSICVFTWRQVC